jgi:hypothetical protein
VDAELVEKFESGLRRPEGRDGPHRLAGQFTECLSFVVLAGEVRHMGAGLRHHLERRVRDVLGDHVPDDDLLPALQLDESEEVLVGLGQVASECVLGLVQVVVRVVDGELGTSRHGGRRLLGSLK